MNNYNIILFILIIGLASCAIDTTMYPPEPQIEFQSLEAEISKNSNGVDTLFYVALYFGLIDGDGDIGTLPLEGPDGTLVPPTNCFIQLYYQEDGEFVEDTLLKATDYTIPYLPNTGQDKTIIADVIIDLPYSLSSQLHFPYDTLFYTIQVEDRQKNQSNIIYTDTIFYSDL